MMGSFRKAKQEKSSIKKTKEQKQREKILNNSLMCLPKSTQKSLGIISIQCEDGVFYLGNDVYLKAYSLNFKTLTPDSRKVLIEKLCNASFCRMRLSSFVKNSSNKPGKVLRFLTVYVKECGYAAAYDEYKRIDDILNVISEETEVSITPCSISNVLTIMHMNFLGEIKNYDINAFIKQREDMKKVIFPNIEEEFNKFQIESSLYGACYTGIEFSEDFAGVYEYFENVKYDIQSCIDIQAMTKEEAEMFHYNLKRRYNYAFGNSEAGRNVNLTFLLSVVNVSPDERERMCKELHREKSMMLMPCTGKQQTVFSSICSLGLIDYHIMRNQKEELIGKLFL